MARLLLLILIIIQSSILSAQWDGYDIYRCGAKGLGAGGAFTAVADDSSAVYYNPAGLVQMRTFTIFYTMDTQLQLAVLSPTIKLTWKVPALLGFVVPTTNSYKTTFSLQLIALFKEKYLMNLQFINLLLEFLRKFLITLPGV